MKAEEFESRSWESSNGCKALAWGFELGFAMVLDVCSFQRFHNMGFRMYDLIY